MYIELVHDGVLIPKVRGWDILEKIKDINILNKKEFESVFINNNFFIDDLKICFSDEQI